MIPSAEEATIYREILTFYDTKLHKWGLLVRYFRENILHVSYKYLAISKAQVANLSSS
jgi:hypothetical protein